MNACKADFRTILLPCGGPAAPGPPGAVADSETLAANAQRIEQRITELSAFGANPGGGVSRVAFSKADIAGREYVKELMRKAGLVVRVDTAGNIIGRREGSDPSLPVIMLGSHIDSVPGGGNYDGDLGVIGAIEVTQLLHEHGVGTRHTLEVVSFTDEEGGLIGGRAMTGRQGGSIGAWSRDPEWHGYSCRYPCARRRSGSPAVGAAQARRIEGLRRAAH